MTRKRTVAVTPPSLNLSRREQQIVDIVHAHAPISAADIHARMPDAPTPNAVRTWIGILEEKGHLRHTKEGARHLYAPTSSWTSVQRSALRHILRAMFDGSPAAVVATLLQVAEKPLTSAERKELLGLIKQARSKDR